MLSRCGNGLKIVLPFDDLFVGSSCLKCYVSKPCIGHRGYFSLFIAQHNHSNNLVLKLFA